MGRFSRWGAAGVVLVLAGLIGLVVVASPAQAAMARNFAIRYQSQDTGDILLRGNTLVTCPTSDANCASAVNRTATGSALNNNNYSMQFIDTDGDSSTHSNSSADVSWPAGASVRFAGLYWSGYASLNGTGVTGPPSGTARDTLKLKVPGETTYRTITAGPSTPANPVDGTAADGTPYVSYADVTSIVQTAGRGSYTGADIFASTGPGAYAAWTLVLVIRDPSLPRRDLIVFDGFGTVQRTPTTDNSQDIALTGLSTPTSGTVDVRLGAVVFEGDAGLTGDHFQIIAPDNTTTSLSNTLNPVDNVFNSTNTDNDVDVAGRVPDGNTFGWDADVFQSSALLGYGATTATLRMNTTSGTGETYFPAVATFVSTVYAPLLDLSRGAVVTDTVADGRTRPGDRITYTIDVKNNGNANSTNTVITDAIPAGTTYLPGSMTIGGSPVTDTADSDAADLSGSTLTFRLGSGANGTTGGTLAPNATARVTYTVQISSPYTTGGTVAGTTNATYTDAAGRAFTGSSNTTSTGVAVARGDLAVTQTTSPAVIQRTGSRTVTWTATVKNNGPDDEPTPQLVEALPTGSTSLSSSGGTCTLSSVTYTCALSALAAGASATVTFTATLPASAPDPVSATATVSGAATDLVPANNTAAVGVAVNTAPTGVPETAVPLNSPATSTDVDVLGNDTDPDSGDTLSISSLTQPGHGTVSVVGGKVRYTLTDPLFVGTDPFTYKVCDNRGGCSDATTSSVAVNDHRRADLKVTQSATPAVVQRGGSLAVSWTAVVTNQGPQSEPGPSLVQDLPAGVTGVTVTGATCTVSGTTYTCPLNPLANGATATVRFAATLPAAAVDPSTAVATVSGPVPDPDAVNNSASAAIGVNRPPVATSDTAALPADVISVDVPAITNDTDPDADPLTVTTAARPAHGTATIVGGKIRYTLTDPGFSGDEVFTYTVCDGRGGCADSTVTVAVADHQVADLSVIAKADPGLVQRAGARGTTWTTTVNNAGPEQSLRTVLTQTFPAGTSNIQASLSTCAVSGVVMTCPLGTLATADTQQITFTATLAEDAPASATAKAVVTSGSADPDASNDTATAAVVVNTAPVAKDDTATLASSATKVTIDVLAKDSDADSDPLTLSSVGRPKHGTAKIVNGRIEYRLTETGFAGTDTFGYETCDNHSACATAQVAVRVADHLHAPAAVADTAGVTAGKTVRIDVTANDHDADGGALTVKKVTGQPRHGTVTVVGNRLVYTPDDGYVGTDSVSYQVCDPGGLCDEATATITVTAPAPVLEPDSGDVLPGGTTVINVLGNDTDPSGRPLGSLSIIQQPGTGTATIGKDNKIHYKAPSSVRPGSVVTIKYQACNPDGVCSVGTVRLRVGGSPAAGGGAAVGDGNTGSLAYTGSRVLPPMVLGSVALLLAGLMTRGLMLPQERRRGRGRHKA